MSPRSDLRQTSCRLQSFVPWHGWHTGLTISELLLMSDYYNEINMDITFYDTSTLYPSRLSMSWSSYWIKISIKYNILKRIDSECLILDDTNITNDKRHRVRLGHGWRSMKFPESYRLRMFRSSWSSREQIHDVEKDQLASHSKVRIAISSGWLLCLSSYNVTSDKETDGLLIKESIRFPIRSFVVYLHLNIRCYDFFFPNSSLYQLGA